MYLDGFRQLLARSLQVGVFFKPFCLLPILPNLLLTSFVEHRQPIQGLIIRRRVRNSSQNLHCTVLDENDPLDEITDWYVRLYRSEIIANISKSNDGKLTCMYRLHLASGVRCGGSLLLPRLWCSESSSTFRELKRCVLDGFILRWLPSCMDRTTLTLDRGPMAPSLGQKWLCFT